ncbi:hypothetical protein KFK09_024592 [Dendrobium nobile]|uniref:Uncharacterized protein n=1 Tax=Dendrobium nobile TaxID=94219 RepID=A0A8T3AEH2_DENNO|nr:hypothetical protein KFK09_024592 [Dendrobium nobile]
MLVGCSTPLLRRSSFSVGSSSSTELGRRSCDPDLRAVLPIEWKRRIGFPSLVQLR